MGMQPITRPNGSIYRPRHLRSTFLGYEDEAPTELAIFGTADIAEGQHLARLEVLAYNAEYYDDLRLELDESPTVVWYSRRLSYFDGDVPYYHYVVDPEKGAHAFLFRLDEVEVQDRYEEDPTVQTAALFEIPEPKEQRG